MSVKPPPSLAQLVEKISLELVFAEPGKDSGLLPVNSLLGEIEDQGAATPWPAAVAEAIALARLAVDTALESGGFTAPILEQLAAWTAWTQQALAAGERAQAPPPLPACLSAPGGTVAAAPDSAPSSAEAVCDEVLHLDLARDAEMLREFLNESEEHLHNIEQGLLTLEQNPKDADTLHSIFRAFHTFKGGSGFLNLVPIHCLAHELESLLDLARQGKLEINGPVINLILAGADTLKRFVSEIQVQLSGLKPPEPIQVPIHGLIERVREVLTGRAMAAAPAAASAATEAAGPTAAVPTADAARRAAARAATGFVKVDTQKLDGLVDLVGELVIAQSLVTQDGDVRSLQSPQLMRHLAQLGRITAELQKTATSLRMVPIKSTFEKMTRLVRDLSLKAGKQVELQFSGEETELDRNLIEELDDPLVHMIRNAVDHGIEKPDVRVAKGKPARGVVQLRAFHQGGNILIEIKDDGAGLNPERLLAKARQQGLAAEGETLSESEIFRFIFAPGFSTAEKITEISGRGVGMDVVRRNIANLRGKIEIASILNQGSAFTIYLPLTLAIIDGLLVGVGDQRFILPTLSVRESFRPTPAMISTVHQRGEMVNVRGRLCPLLRLHRHFDIAPQTEDPAQAIIIVLESNHELRCLMVDQLLGKQEVVIKSLGETFKASHALAGAAILGDGRVGLILDVNNLIHLGNGTFNGTAAPVLQEVAALA
jgi:two-component system chemotaxis sensor kinase CheA